MKSHRWHQQTDAERPSVSSAIELVLAVVAGSFILGSLPFIYGPGWFKPTDLQVRPTEAGLWQELGERN